MFEFGYFDLDWLAVSACMFSVVGGWVCLLDWFWLIAALFSLLCFGCVCFGSFMLFVMIWWVFGLLSNLCLGLVVFASLGFACFVGVIYGSDYLCFAWLFAFDYGLAVWITFDLIVVLISLLVGWSLFDLIY